MIQSQPTIDELIETISTQEVGMPVAEMSRLIDLGPAAAEPVAAALERWRHGEERELLWLVVVAGELRDERAIAPLVGLVGQEGWTELQAAAAEALAKLGDPALPVLFGLARAGAPHERIWAYACLGWIGGDDAYRTLLAALERDAELVEVAALALGDLGRREAVPAIYEALTRCAPWQRVDMEEALKGLHHGRRPDPISTTDWRVRYRRQPSLGVCLPCWPVIPSVILNRPEVRGDRPDIPVRPLEQILADPPEPEEPLEICDECGGPVVYHTGLAVCPETALPAVIEQIDLLDEARDRGLEDIFEVWNDAEAGALLVEMDEESHPEWKDRLQEEKDQVAIEWATCQWLMSEGIDTIDAAKARLLVEAARLADRYGDPDGLLDDTTPIARPPLPGRNDPCPCGSGKKYKLCCGRPH
jgi:hypothetical protein